MGKQIAVIPLFTGQTMLYTAGTYNADPINTVVGDVAADYMILEGRSSGITGGDGTTAKLLRTIGYATQADALAKTEGNHDAYLEMAAYINTVKTAEAVTIDIANATPEDCSFIAMVSLNMAANEAHFGLPQWLRVRLNSGGTNVTAGTFDLRARLISLG